MTSSFPSIPLLLISLNVMCTHVATALLQLCDKLRDDHLPDLGVILEDKEEHTVVKYVGKEAGRREKENARKVERGRME